MASSRKPRSMRTAFSSEGKQGLPNSIAPLQVDRSVDMNRWIGKPEEDAAGTQSEGSNDNSHVLTSRLGMQIATRMNELSQLESPLLRELARRLGEHLKVEAPKCFETFQHPYAELHVGEKWEEYQGRNEWEGLLRPDCDRVLKGEILRYGEFAQAAYDAFDNDFFSRHRGTCKYTKTELLEQVGLENRGYEITNFLYATTDINLYPHLLVRSESAGDVEKSQRYDQASEQLNERSKHGNDDKCEEANENSKSGDPICRQRSQPNNQQSNWIGFVAVCNSEKEITRLGRRDILVAWRGTVRKLQWIADFMDYSKPAGFGPDRTSSSERVESGFAHLYTSKNSKSNHNQTQSARDQVREALKAVIAKYKRDGKLSITITGHSLGSALAILCAYDIAVCEDNLLSGETTVSDEWSFTESRHEDGHSWLPEHLDILSKDHGLHFPGSHGDGENRNHYGHNFAKVTQRVEKLIVSKEKKFTDKFRKDRVPVTVYSFGGPRVGNQAFVDRMEELGVAVLRVVNKFDRVTKLPGLVDHFLQKNFQKGVDLEKKYQQFIDFTPFSYRHVGVCLEVDNTMSEYLKRHAGPFRAHNLELYLHLVDSYQGIDEKYQGHKKSIGERLHLVYKQNEYKPYRKTFRDHALVNKRIDLLKQKYRIPPFWWQEKNKGLVRSADGEWGIPHRDETEDETTARSQDPEQDEKEFEEYITKACERSRLAHNSHGFTYDEELEGELLETNRSI